MKFALTAVLLLASMVASSMSMATGANSCSGACGVNADCEVRGHVPVCSCPRNMTGDPFKSCRPITDADQCNPNPCGVNAACHPGHDSTDNVRPVCTCPAGYSDNSLVSCQRI